MDYGHASPFSGSGPQICPCLIVSLCKEMTAVAFASSVRMMRSLLLFCMCFLTLTRQIQRQYLVPGLRPLMAPLDHSFTRRPKRPRRWVALPQSVSEDLIVIDDDSSLSAEDIAYLAALLNQVRKERIAAATSFDLTTGKEEEQRHQPYRRDPLRSSNSGASLVERPSTSTHAPRYSWTCTILAASGATMNSRSLMLCRSSCP